MKKQFGNLFYIVPVEKVVSVSGNSVVIKDEEEMDLILAENDIELNEVLTKAGANDYFKQSSSAVTKSVSESIIKKYRKSKVVIQLKTTEGDLYTLGNTEVPVRVEVNRSVRVDKWNITCNSDRSAFN
nr:hypothetical protein [uncultured Carboxylicivirga sp.]